MKILLGFLLLLPCCLHGQEIDTGYKKYDLLPGTHPKTITTKGDPIFPIIIDSLAEDGKMIEKRQYFSKGSGRRTVYRYNSRGRISRRDVYNLGSRAQYERFDYAYTRNGFTMKEYSLDFEPSPKLICTTTGRYNSSNQLEQIVLQYHEDTALYTMRCHYDSNGRVVREERDHFDLPDGTQKGKVSLINYDRQGMIAGVFYPGDDNLPAFEILFSYPAADEKGNWTKRNELFRLEDKEGAIRVLYRELSYYDR